MAQTTFQWARQTFTVKEDGRHVTRVRLLASDSVWQTWFPESWSGPDAEAAIQQWCKEVDDTVLGLCEEWPSRHISVVLCAEDDQLNVVSQHVRSVRGRNREANSKVFGSDNMAQAQAMDSLARTMERVLSSASVHCDQMAATNRQLMQHTDMLLQELQAEKLARLDGPKGEDPGVQEFQRQFFTQLPALVELGFAWLRERNGDQGALGRAAVQQASRAAASAGMLTPEPTGENIQ